MSSATDSAVASRARALSPRDAVHDPRLLDTLFGIALSLVVGGALGDGSIPVNVMPIVLAVPILAGWVWWRIRRRRGLRSPGLAIALGVLALVLYVSANNISSLGVQWIVVLVLTLELGLAGSIGFTIVVCVATLIIHVTVGYGLERGAFEAIASGLMLALGIDFAALLGRAERIDAERSAALVDLERAHEEQARRHAREQDLVLAEERARVATALHDGLGHRLTAIGMSLEFSERMRERDPERAAAEVRAARAMAGEALDEMRMVVRAMHPAESAAGDAADTLAAVATSFSSTSLDVSFERMGEGRLEADHGLLLLRFAQEGLTNVVRHAAATRALLRLEHAAGGIRVELLDDGEGSSRDASPTEGFGIRALRERAEAMGGTLEALPGRGLERDAPNSRGFRLAMTLPAMTLPASGATS